MTGSREMSKPSEVRSQCIRPSFHNTSVGEALDLHIHRIFQILRPRIHVVLSGVETRIGRRNQFPSRCLHQASLPLCGIPWSPLRLKGLQDQFFRTS